MSNGFGEPQGQHDHSDAAAGKELRPGEVLVVPKYPSVSDAPDEQGAVVHVDGSVYKRGNSQYTKLSEAGEVSTHAHNGPNDGGSSLGTSTDNVKTIFTEEVNGSLTSGQSLTSIEGNQLHVDSVGTMGIVADGITDREISAAISPTWTSTHQFDAGLVTGSLEMAGDSGSVPLIDMPVTSASTAGSEQSISLLVDGQSIATAYAESDGAGGIQSKMFDVPAGAIGVNGTQVVTSQQSSIPLLTSSLSSTTVDGVLESLSSSYTPAEIERNLSELEDRVEQTISALRAHGLIA